MTIGVVRLCCHDALMKLTLAAGQDVARDRIGLRLRFVSFTARKQQVSKIDARLVVRGLQLHRAPQFTIRCAILAQMLIRLRQFVMSIGVALVDLHGV